VDVDAGAVTPARACVSGAFGHAWDGPREATICADGTLVTDDRVVTTAFGGALGRPERVLLLPDSSIVVGGTFQGTVAFVDTRTGATLRVLTPDGSPIRDLSSSPSGRLLAVATERGGVSVWRVDTGARVLQLPKERVDRVQFVDEERLAVSGRTWALWAVPTDARPWRLARPHGVGALAASGQWVAGAYGDGAAVAWRVDDGRSTEVRWQGEVAKDVTFDAVGFRCWGWTR
jgi:WD40 repeat protein